jgi:spoIIIJ-associated protein
MNFLKDFIRDIGLGCEVKGDLTLNEKGFVSRVITIEGEDAPSLIGHRGDMLDALQYLANLCLARKSEGDHKEYVKVIVDIAGYREKREQTLRSLARRMAEKAIKFQRNVPLEPMNPYERMIIHSEIQGIEGVSTHSVGYDENRKIVICPDKKRNKK